MDDARERNRTTLQGGGSPITREMRTVGIFSMAIFHSTFLGIEVGSPTAGNHVREARPRLGELWRRMLSKASGTISVASS